MKILSFAPFQVWDVHTQLDITLLRSLQLRGAETVMVNCDKLFLPSVCYAAGSDPTKWQDYCNTCHARAQQLHETVGRQLYLGAYLTPEDHQRIEAWVGDLRARNALEAVWGDWDIGAWVIGTVYTNLKSLRKDTPAFLELYHRYCHSGLLCATALDRILNQESPDKAIVFGGRDAPHRIATELLKRRSTPIIFHEKGWADDRFIVSSNRSFFDMVLDKVYHPLHDWLQLPLSDEQCWRVKNYLTLRQHGLGMNWHSYLTNSTDPSEIRQLLGIPAEATVCTICGTTPYELEGILDYGVQEYHAFMEDMVGAFAHRSEWLVIRMHPNITGPRVSGVDYAMIEQYRELARHASPNVRIIFPDEPINTYALLAISSAVFSPFSSLVYESACQGLPTAAMKSWLSNAAAITFQRSSKEQMGPLIDQLLYEKPFADIDLLRRAYRLIYSLIERITTRFASFGVRDIYFADQRYSTLEDLAPGHDAELDRLSNHLLQDEEFYGPQSGGSLEEETRFLTVETDSIKQQRALLEDKVRRKTQLTLQAPVTAVRIQSAIAALRPTSKDQFHATFECAENAQEILSAVREVKTSYILLAHGQMEYCEGFLTSLAQVLRDDLDAQVAGARHGAWLSGPNGGIWSEILTQRTKDSWAADEVWQTYNIWALLGLGLYRQAHLQQWLESAVTIADADEFRRSAKEFFLSSSLQSPAIPMAILHHS